MLCRGHRRATSKQWEHTRLISYTIAASNRDPNKSFPTIEAYFPLPTDEDAIATKEEDLNEMRANLVKYYNSVYGKNLA